MAKNTKSGALSKSGKSKPGRPTRICTNKDINTIRELLLLGATVKQVCKSLDISDATYYKWRKENKLVTQTIKEVHELQTDNVEKSLYKRASGYNVTETTTNKNPDGEVKSITEKTRHIPADTASMIFYLTNQRPEQWKNKQIHDINARPLVKRNVKRFDGIKDVKEG